MIRALWAKYGAVISRDDSRPSASVKTWTAGERNVRVPVQVNPQEAPDPIRQSDVLARPAMNQVATFSYDTASWEAESMVAGVDNANIEGVLASTPYGRQAVWNERANIAPPQHVAYGSLFYTDTAVYGYA